MTEFFKLLVNFIVSGVLLLVFVDESECCLRKTEHAISRKAILYSQIFQHCSCIGDMKKLKYILWTDSCGNDIPEVRPGTHLNIYAERTDDGINLWIKNFTADMSGTYYCIANYDHKYFGNSFKLQEYEPIHFVNTEPKQFLIKGMDSRISCEVSNDGSPYMTVWHRPDIDYQIEGNERYLKDRKGLVIKNVEDSDAGIYKCRTESLLTGYSLDIIIAVEVFSIRDITEIEVIPNRTVVTGDFLKIVCVGSGNPLPNYNWSKIINEKPFALPQDNSSWYIENDTLTFESIRAEDRGTYRCTAYNMAGVVTKQVTIEVFEPPEITEFNNVTVEEGQSAELICRVRSSPLPRVNLFFEEIAILHDFGKSVEIHFISATEMTFHFIIEQVSRSDHGLYKCQAINDVDNTNYYSSAYLNVLFKPVFEKPVEVVWGWRGLLLNLSCLYESNPEGTITWRLPENAINKSGTVLSHEQVAPLLLDEIPLYGNYSCTAVNELGAATKVIYFKEAHPPRPLISVQIDSISATSVTFSIEGPPTVEGPPITAYTAEYDKEDKYYTTNIHYNRTWDVYRPYKVEKLNPDTLYLFRFAAINIVGTGDLSSLMELKTKKRSPPEKPVWKDTTADEYNSMNSVILSWNVPKDNGEPIDRYELHYCEVEEDDYIPHLCYTEVAYQNNIMLQNLKPNTTYHVKLYAHNSVGNSAAAEKFVRTSGAPEDLPSLSASNIIGLSVLLVVICLVVFDLVLCCWKDQGVIANVCCWKRKQKRNATIQESQSIRDKKGLLRDGESPTSVVRPEKGHKEFVYEENTGLLLRDKHSAI